LDQQTPETTPNYTLKDEGYFVLGISRLLIMIRVFGWIDQSGALIKTAYLIIRTFIGLFLLPQRTTKILPVVCACLTSAVD
jgi:hypothetical protein